VIFVIFVIFVVEFNFFGDGDGDGNGNGEEMQSSTLRFDRSPNCFDLKASC